MNKFTKQCIAAVASLAMAGTMCVAGAVTVSGSAWASSSQTATQDPLAPWTKGAPTTAKLTIMKYKYVTGTKDDAKKENALAGATFTVTKVASINVKDGNSSTKTVTLSNFADYSTWQNIASVVADLNDGKDSVATLDTNTVYTGTTDESGKAVIQTSGKKDLPLGLYKVEETGFPSNYSVNDLKSFYITLPLVEQKNSKNYFNYDVTIKPKNKDISGSITKTLDNEKNIAGVDDTFNYTIASQVVTTASPAPAKGKWSKDDIQGFAVFDDSPISLAAKDSNKKDQTLDKAVTEVKIGTTTLTPTTDYKVTIPTSTTDSDHSGNIENGRSRILVSFTDAGLTAIATALNNATSDAPKISVKLSFKVADAFKSSAIAKNNQIVNKSGLFKGHGKNQTPDNNPVIPGGKNPSSEKTTEFGTLQVNKHEDGKPNTKLPGAEFKIFTNSQNANACSKGLSEGKALKDVAECKAATAFDGTTESTGAFKTAYKAAVGTIYIVEVKAPDKYVLSPRVMSETIKKGELTTADFPNMLAQGGDHNSWFKLPATGAAGVFIFALAGIILIAASVFIYTRNNRKEERKQRA
ncbi:SpaH/EbpB family LPXTG-anchored major pilin [Gardnerella vaginalis]|uniref:SpaH/EbpB family LPXTG-anchored major pilin n=1 Tax=Gardnerella vaginalis TaxID=2702 RepID=UPI0039EEF4D8